VKDRSDSVWTREIRELALATPGYFPLTELDALYQEAASAAALCPLPLVEIGSFCGRSTLALAAAARENGQLVISIDHHRGSVEMLEPFPYFDPRMVDPVHSRFDSSIRLIDTLELSGLRSFVVTVAAENRTALAICSFKASAVLIDGGHDEINPWWDLALALELLDDNGTLFIHDVFDDPDQGGQMPRAIERAASMRGWFTERRSGSLAILRKRLESGAGAAEHP
jgi:hypothetical protein